MIGKAELQTVMYKKLYKIFLGIVLSSILIFCFGPKAYAGFGDFNDYDYGGSDWGDSDWGGSDWGTNYSTWDDDDYSSGSSGDFSGGITDLVIVLVIIVAVLYFSNKRQQTSHTAPPVRNENKMYTLPERNEIISQVIQKHDSAFTATDFVSFARQVYLDIQDAWMKRDLEPVRAVLHQNLYQQTERQLEQKRAQGIVNYLERISVNTAYLTSYKKDKEYEYLSVYLAASMIDYQVKEQTGEVVYGDKSTRWNLKYKMTFVRTLGSKTRSAKEKDTGWTCPNCGAPLKGTSFGKCEYCDSVVTTGLYDWVLSSFGVVKSDTVDEGVVE